MIDFKDEQYGRVIIVDREENPKEFDMYLYNFMHNCSKYSTDFEKLTTVSIFSSQSVPLILLRNRKKGQIAVIKNIHNWNLLAIIKRFKDMDFGVFESIESRFDILDIR